MNTNRNLKYYSCFIGAKTITDSFFFNSIDQLEEEDKNAIYRIIDTMLTKSKFKDFFNKNVAAL